MSRIQRAKTAKDIYAKKRDILPFEGDWQKHLGTPEIIGSWFVYGHSGHGKTSYLTQMAKYLTNFGAVWYNGLEEGDSYSFEEAMKRAGLGTVGNKFLQITDNYEQLMYRLSRRNRARFVFIDSLQVMQMSKPEYHAMLDKYKTVQFIIIGHAEGRKPEGRIGKYIEYLSFIKIWVEGFKATAKSRYGGNEPFVIYPKRAAEYWGEVV